MKEWDNLNELFKRPQFASDGSIEGDTEGSGQDADHDDSGGDDD